MASNSTQPNKPNNFSFKSTVGQVSTVTVKSVFGSTITAAAILEYSGILSSTVYDACESVAKMYGKDEQFKEGVKKYGYGPDGLGFINGIFSLFGGKGYAGSLVDTDLLINEDSNQASIKLANIISQMSEQKIYVKGKIEAKGQSDVVAEASIFVSVTAFKGVDSKGNPVDLKIIGSNLPASGTGGNVDNLLK